MGHQPKLELELTDLPRPEPKRNPERRWRPERPGDIVSPDEMPWGGLFGVIGPDTGYALRLLSTFDFDPKPLEPSDVASAVALLAGARASRNGRAPVREDVELALTLLGFLSDGLPDDLIDSLRRWRYQTLANAGHEPQKAQRLLASLPLEVLDLDPHDARRRMSAGERLVPLPAPG